jgi:hypothetical protein
MNPTDPAVKPAKEESVLLEWSSPARPFQPHTRQYYKTAGALVFLVSVILVFIGEFLLIGVIVSLFFVIYVLSTVPPEKISHKITHLGIETAGNFHKWEEMREFWFDERSGQRMLVIQMLIGFPAHLQLLLGTMNEEKIRHVLAERLPYKEKPERTFLDNASKWLSQKIPLERTS